MKFESTLENHCLEEEFRKLYQFYHEPKKFDEPKNEMEGMLIFIFLLMSHFL